MRTTKTILPAVLAFVALLFAVGTGIRAQDAVQDQPEPATATQAASTPADGDGSLDAATGAVPLVKDDVDAWLDGFMPYALQKGDVAGAVVVVVKGGEVVTQRGFGYADMDERTPVDPDLTLFRPGSVSKLVTWTAVMQMVEQGKVDLDADINQYLDFRIPDRNGEPVTMRQVMTHTAGFEEQVKNLIGFEREAVPAYDVILKRWVPERIFDAGTTPAYSNYATSLAGYVVERVSGEPFDDYVETHIFQPLGMNNSTFRQPLPDNLKPHMATGYSEASKEPVPFNIVGPAPAGSMSSTGADMGRFMTAHLNGGELNGQRILKAETAREMHTTALDLGMPLDRMLLGFFETNINGRTVIAHLGDLDGFHTSLHLFLDDDTGLYASFNSDGEEGAVGALRIALFEEFADRYFPGETSESRVDPKLAAEHAQMMAGNWVASRRADSTFLNITQLIGQTTVAAGPDGEIILPPKFGLSGRNTKWVEVEPFVWQDLNSHQRMAAVVKDGKVVRFSLSIMSAFTVFERAPWYKDASLLMPLLYASLAILFLTAILWPVRALVRRHYKTELPLTGRERLGYRLSRIGAWAIVLVLIGWAVAITLMFDDLSNLGGGFDMVVLALQVLSFVAFLGGTAVFAWYLWQVWTGGRRWTAKVWSVLLLLAGLVVVWVGAAFHLLSIGTNY
ncbi:serine hydrolase domain-containing protein [Croceicoccus naphthovorans]|uniref:Beta-lactamase n=1 Tax=Croceicoccus naphthovorans TaxID=1348774 RepID=A0A0G3XMH1_9SPHN|nr:serine hydrolase domain-containing protein [Croceicoccus naphthovorans]AKM11879.1 beta-lactamase [Croceicoccus naphthovorans]MBB3989132.1 CubicO group peptidase (beta-lactamase class C family) [Croceicoccus naphthovorans]